MRQWISERYDANAWFRLALLAVVIAVNFLFMGAVLMPLFALELSNWIMVPLMLCWTFGLAGAFTWLVTARLDEDGLGTTTKRKEPTESTQCP